LGSYDPYWPTYTVSISGTNNVFTYQTNVVAGVTNVYTTTNFVSLAYSTNSIISVVTADVNGDFIVNGGGAISPITSVAPGLATWTINGDLTLDNSKLISAPNNLNRVNFLLNTTTTPGGGTNDLIAVSGTLYIGDELDVVVTPLTGTLANGKYTLFTCGTAYVPYGNSAIDSDSDPANLVLIAPRGIVGPAGDPTHPFSSDLHNVYLTVSGTASPGSLIWQGTPALNNWNVHLSQNWKTNGTYTPAAQYFYSLDNVIFDDTGVGTVVLPTVVNPSSLAFNNSLTNYTFTQNASTFITGTSGLVKNGSGTVTLQNPNSFTGDITVNNGTLACGYYSGAGGVQKTLYNGVPAGNLILSGGTINLNETQINSTPEADFQNVTINPGASAMTQSGRTAGSTPIYVISNNMTRAVGGTLNLVMQTSPTIGYGTDNGGHCGIFFANTNAQGYYGVNRILGGYATFALSDWVVANNTNTGSHALGEYQTGTTPGLWASTDNVSVSSAISGIGTQTINSLKLNPNSAYAVSINPSQTLTLSSGGLLIPNATTPYQIILTGGTLQGPKNADVIVLNNNITVGSSLRIDTPIQDNTDPGPCALTLSGGGTTILTGNNTYTGPTYINNGISGATPGTLQIGANGTSGSIAYSSAIIDNGTLAFSRSDNTSAGAISGTGSLQKLGGGVLTLTANNSLSGSVTISAGTLQLGTGGAVGSVSNTTAIVDNGTLVFDNNNTVSYSKPISGYGGLVQFGSGNLIIATNEAYSGATTVSNGTMTLTASGSIPNTTAITVNAGALLDVSAVSGGLVLRSTAPAEVLSGSGTINGSVTTASGTTVSPGNSSGAIGTLTINNDLALSGGSFLFDVGNASSDRINSATLHENSGTVVINVTGGTLNNGVYKLVHTTSASITGSASSLGLFGFNQPGQIGVLTNEASGDLSLLVYSGTITTLTWVGGVSANAWDIAGSANWTTGSGTTTYANPDYVVINDSGANTPAISMNAALSPTTLTLNNNTEAYTLGVSGNTGKITGGASLIVNGTAGVTLLTKNDYLGGTTIAAGPVTLGDNASASNDGMVGGSGSIVNNGTLVANDYGTETINGAISGSGQLVQRGAGTLILAGNNSAYSGGISNSTTLQMGNGYTGTLGTGIITNNSSVVFNVGPTPASIVAVNANITGTGGITNLGPGIVTLNGSNTYSGKTTIDNGTVRLGSDNAILGTSGIFMDTAISPAAVGTLDLNGHNITVPTLQGANTGSANANIVVGKILNNGTGVATLTIGGGATMTNNAELLDNNNGGTGQLALLVTNNSYVYLYSDWNNLQTTIYPNLFSGGIIISNASVVLGFNAGNNLTPGNEGTAAAGTGPITLLGGHGLVIDGRTGAPTNGMLFACNNGGSSSPTVNTTVGTINVPTGEYGTIFGSMRGTLAGSLAGGGTVTLSTEYVRGHFNLADAGFNGTVILAGLNVGGGAGGNYGIESSAGWGGWPNATVFCHTNNLSTIDVCSTSTGFVQFGSLSGGDNTCLFDGAPGPSGFGGINTIYAIGSLGTSAPGVSTTNGSQFIAGVGIRKVGYGSLTLTNNVLSYGGETVVSNGTLAFIPLGNNPGAFNPLTNNYLVGSNYTIVSPGILDVSQAGNTLYLGRCTNSAYTQTLFGNGTLNGNLVTMVSSNSIVAPGYRADNPNIYSGGQLTVSGTATFNSGSTVIISINSTSGVGGTFTNDSVNALGGLTVNQTRLTIVNTGGAFAPSSTNVIYAFWDPNTPVPVPFGSSGVTNLTLPALAAGEYWVTNLSGGNLVSLAVVDTNAALNASAPPLQVAVSGNTLKLGWPTNRGWILQAQTNVSSIGLSNNWVDVPGSALITNTVITVDSNQPAVFYRMRNPSAPVR
jgi:autotransporter-associated beta strand protein